MRPSFVPESTSTYTKKKIKATQAWHKNGRCPKNTVPIRRIKKEDILRSKSIKSYGKKTTPSSPQATTFDPSKGHEVHILYCFCFNHSLVSLPALFTLFPFLELVQYAVMNSMNGTFFGTQFSVNIWKPEVQVADEFSLAQTWLVSGVGTTRNTIEAGLQVLYFF